MEVFNRTRLDNAPALSQTESSLIRWSQDEELARLLSNSKGDSRLHTQVILKRGISSEIDCVPKKNSEFRQKNLGDINTTNHPNFGFTGIV